MIGQLLLNPGLRDASRLQRLTHKGDVAVAAEWLTLCGVGIFAAAISTLVDLHLRIPGHAILKVVFPVSAGLALVPRKGAGTVICASAFGTALLLRGVGAEGDGLGLGALTSLTAIGPLMDWMLRRASSVRSVYLGVMVAGLLANLAALAVKASMKGLGLEHEGGRSLAAWISQAAITYTLCGLAAGLLSALVWFCSRSTPPREQLQ